MLINPSPTTLLAMWRSGRAAGGRQQRAGPGTHRPPRPPCPAQVLQHGRTRRPPRPGPTATEVTAATWLGECQGHCHGGRTQLLVEQQRQRGRRGCCTAAGGAEEASPSLLAEWHHVAEGHTVGCVGPWGLPAAPAQALSPVPPRLLPSKCASYYGDITSLAQEEPNKVHLCRVTLFSAADLDMRSPGRGQVLGLPPGQHSAACTPALGSGPGAMAVPKAGGPTVLVLALPCPMGEHGIHRGLCHPAIS